MADRGTGRFRGEGAVVTGGSRGIGAAIARALADEGFRLMLVARDPSVLRERAAELERRGAQVTTLPLDLTAPDAPGRVHATTLATLGVPYLLVNNAGVGFSARFARKDPEEVERELTLDLLVPARLDRAFLPDLLARGRGHLVHLGSGSADVGLPRLATYSGAKAGLRHFSRTLDLELRRSGVRSTVVEPIYVRTEFGRRAADPEAPLVALARQHPRLVLEPELVADYVVAALHRPRAVVKVPWAWAIASPLARLGARLAAGRLALRPDAPSPPQ